MDECLLMPEYRLHDGIIIFMCTSEVDVATVVQFATKHQKPIHIQSGGHYYLETTDSIAGVVIDLSNMNDVTVDVDSRIVIVEAGATVEATDAETQKHGLATPTGTVSEAGMGDLVSRGGSGYLRGKYGLTCDNLIAAHVITENGEQIRASKSEHPDLYWALRGGGRVHFGVVTSVELQLYSVGPNILAMDVMYDYQDIRQILKKLQAYMQTAPDEITVNLAITQLPTTPFSPRELRQKRVVTVKGMYIGELNSLQEEYVIQPLLELAKPIKDKTFIKPYMEMQQQNEPMASNSVRVDRIALFFKELNREAIEILTEEMERIYLRPVSVQLLPLHGQMNRIPPDAAAFPVRNDGFLLRVDTKGEQDKKKADWMKELYEKLLPFSYQPVSSSHVDTQINWATVADKVAEIKEKYDPNYLFCHDNIIVPE